MAGVAGPSGDEVPSWWAERNNKQAERLLKLFDAAKPISKLAVGVPHLDGGGGSDHPKPQGPFVHILFQPFVWPVDSETHLANDADTLLDESKLYEDNAMDARQAANGVFDGGSWVGKSADAARTAYNEAASIKFRQAEVSRVASGLFKRASSDIGMTKRLMSNESDTAHKEAEAFLRSRSGQSLAQLAVILVAHRTTIQGYSSDLQAFATQYTTQFTNHFAQSPAGGPKVRQAGHDTSSDQSSDGDTPPGPAPGASPAVTGGGGVHSPASSGGQGNQPTLPSGPLSAPSSDGLPHPRHNPLTSLMGGGLPGLPGMPGGGPGGGLPMGPLQGLMSGFGGFPGGMATPTGLSAPGLQGSPMQSLGMDFGRGLAAGASAAGAVPPVTQAPLTPLAAPVETAPTSAAPAAAPVPAAPPTAASAPAPAPAAGIPGGGLTSYGSVLPPQGMSGAPPAGSAPAAPSLPAEAGGGSSGSGPGTGLMPVAGRREAAAVRRDLAASDLELARMAVAELAGAASVTDPGLDWAVAVGRNTSGMPTLWVATNDGAAYIPPGVFLRKTMPVAGGHSEEFDSRWFGWVNPADKAVRAARECGDSVGAVATTWAWSSEFLAEHPAVTEVATGVKPVGAVDNPAAELLPSRSHRLQTVDAALYTDLVAADESMVRDYCRELTRQLAFSIPGEELSPVAQSVAHALVAQRWPKAEEWALLGEEHEDALVMMAAQRPGLNGVENPDQVLSYTREFVKCRRLEALLCWERHGADLLNMVYAAWVAGVRAPLKDLVLT
ncbi:hypothetical protein LTQ55_12135 [Mycobacterium intracellulare]|uniref:hypothetical protein n=1 Tax=Mycobacterium intracellulare TaxID=1767 RepID=UPI001E42C70F|nr:hypothetical protein [Mycobacterium intracellulare]UGT99232.1 hypothetical protein LTQ55_12135 [Mycobacterium intracellulare]